jgi:predicted membrane protein
VGVDAVLITESPLFFRNINRLLLWDIPFSEVWKILSLLLAIPYSYKAVISVMTDHVEV